MRLATIIALGSLSAIALSGVSFAQSAGELPDAPGKEQLVNTCATCHEMSVVVSQHKTPEEWAATVQKMIETGALVSDEDKPVIIAYLAKYFGAPAKGDAATPPPPPKS